MEFLYVAIIAVFLVDPIKAIKCDDNACTKRGKQHPLCIYPKPDPSQACGNITSIGLSENDRVEIVEKHNYLRWYVAQGYEARGNPGPQPPATNMKLLLWDHELAETAQRWVNQCDFKYADCVDDDRFQVGQSLAKGNTTNAKPSKIINKFYKYVDEMDRSQVYTLRENSKAFLYIQLVWANTSRIGCGKIEYRTEDGIIKYFMMCLYGPRGNVIGEPVYDIFD